MENKTKFINSSRRLRERYVDLDRKIRRTKLIEEPKIEKVPVVRLARIKVVPKEKEVPKSPTVTLSDIEKDLELSDSGSEAGLPVPLHKIKKEIIEENEEDLFPVLCSQPGSTSPLEDLLMEFERNTSEWYGDDVISISTEWSVEGNHTNEEQPEVQDIEDPPTELSELPELPRVTDMEVGVGLGNPVVAGTIENLTGKLLPPQLWAYVVELVRLGSRPRRLNFSKEVDGIWYRIRVSKFGKASVRLEKKIKTIN